MVRAGDRVQDEVIARRCPVSTRPADPRNAVTMLRMALPWVGLIVLLVATVAGAALVGIRALAAWRALRAFQRRFDSAVAETTRLFDGIEPRVAKASATATQLEAARARLQESVTTASLLFGALGEALALVRRVTGFVPR